MAHDGTAGLDGRQIAQGDIMQQVDIAPAKGVIGDQPDGDDIANGVTFECRLQTRKKHTRPVQVADRRSGGLTDYHVAGAAQCILHGDDLVAGDLRCNHCSGHFPAVA